MLTPQALSCFGALYLNGQSAENPLASPVYGDCTGLPPLLIHVGSEEILLDDSIRFAENAKAAGVDVNLEEWPGMMHDWHLMARFIPEGKRAIAGIGEFVRARTAA
jgi:acetyl esterase/lipase